MARRNAKADRILNDSAMRLEAALIRERLAQSQLNTAKAVLEVAQQAHDALVKELTSAPQKKTQKPPASAPAPVEPAGDRIVPDARCVAQVPTLDVPCGEREDALIHDPKGGYGSYHPFEASKRVARAPRKSKPKPEATSSDQSSGTVTEGAGVAALAASGGE